MAREQKNNESIFQRLKTTEKSLVEKLKKHKMKRKNRKKCYKEAVNTFISLKTPTPTIVQTYEKLFYNLIKSKKWTPVKHLSL